MDRRSFIRNAISGLFIASQPKIIIDLAANTFRKPNYGDFEMDPIYQGRMTLNNGLVKKAWEEKLFNDVMKESYFAKFMYEGSESVLSGFTEGGLINAQKNIAFSLKP